MIADVRAVLIWGLGMSWTRGIDSRRVQYVSCVQGILLIPVMEIHGKSQKITDMGFGENHGSHGKGRIPSH